MDEPSTTDLANAAAASYADTAPENYTQVEELSSPDIKTYKHNEKSHYIISHRGTDLKSDTMSKQVKADMNILLGNSEQSKLHRNRVKETEKIVKSIVAKDPQHSIHLTGHSLGGSTAHQAVLKSKIVRDNVKSLDTFNAGSSPLQSKGLAKSNPNYSKIADMSTHHRIQGDDISASIKSNLVGKTIAYASQKKPTIAQKVLKFAGPVLKRSTLGKLVHFGADRLLNTLSSHSMDNFTHH